MFSEQLDIHAVVVHISACKYSAAAVRCWRRRKLGAPLLAFFEKWAHSRRWRRNPQFFVNLFFVTRGRCGPSQRLLLHNRAGGAGAHFSKTARSGVPPVLFCQHLRTCALYLPVEMWATRRHFTPSHVRPYGRDPLEGLPLFACKVRHVRWGLKHVGEGADGDTHTALRAAQLCMNCHPDRSEGSRHATKSRSLASLGMTNIHEDKSSRL